MRTCRTTIEAASIDFRCYELPSYNLRQIFVNDPNGITLELNFRQ